MLKDFFKIVFSLGSIMIFFFFLEVYHIAMLSGLLPDSMMSIAFDRQLNFVDSHSFYNSLLNIGLSMFLHLKF